MNLPDLTPGERRIFLALLDVHGAWVDSETLAERAGVTFGSLKVMVHSIRKKRPYGLGIESRNRCGYRVVEVSE